MNNLTRAIIIAALIITVGVVIAVKHNNKDKQVETQQQQEQQVAVAVEVKIENNITLSAEEKTPEVEETTEPQSLSKPEVEKVLPRLVDLGAGKCVACKMMKPILEELKSEYGDVFQVDFIDVWENPDEAKKYAIKLIPTQIFIDDSGKERFRHEGFMSTDDILAKWKEFGIEVK